jgi:drug/metabolite transporter (DMT)-like permease
MRRFFLGRSPAATGVLVMLLGMLMFAMNDAMGKWLVTSYSLGQVVLIRSLAALVMLSPMLWKTGAVSLTRVERPWLQLSRVVLSTIDVFGFYFAVAYMPLADVMTYWLAGPIYVAALSPFLLGEKVGWRRWSAIVVGFIGVLVALQPGAATLTLPALISIAGSAAFAFMIVSGRQLRNTPDSTLAFWQLMGAGIVGVVLAPFDWRPIDSSMDLALLCLLGVVSTSAHLLVNRALKLADAAAVAPLQYTLLLWAIIFGWMFFGDVPQTHMLAGAALIVASGLYIVFRENWLKKNRPETTEAVRSIQNG